MSSPLRSRRSLTIISRRSIHARRRKLRQRAIEESSMKISREDVLRVAELAYLDLSEAELEMYRAQIDEILEYIGKLNELDTANVEPMAQVLSGDQTADATLREDLIVPCAVAEDVLKHAPAPVTAPGRCSAPDSLLQSAHRNPELNTYLALSPE